jgi:peptidyl-prolyl cis-trans isomerase SurA
LVHAIKEFLPLYIDYRAKLESARDAELFTNPEILAELETYELQTAFPYWLENKVKTELLNELDERTKVELNASHILITLPPNPTPNDTLNVYNRLIEARSKAVAGGNFDSLSTVYSSVQNGRSVGGSLGYFSGGWAVKEFEDVAYSLNPGDISMPFRTQFGYHVIKLYDIRDASPDRLVSHVYLRVPSEDQVDEVIEQAMQGYNEYKSGQIDWANFVQNYSQDPQSGPVEGRIGWVNHGRYDPRFTDVIMGMNAPGDVTEPFFSGYGVHVVRLDSIKTYVSEEQRLNELSTRLQSLPRYRNNRAYTLENVRKSGSETVSDVVLDSFETMIRENGNAPYESIQLSQEVKAQVVYTLNGSQHTLGEYVDWIISNTDATSSSNYNFGYRNEFFNAMAEKQIVPITKEVFPEFGRLSREYLNGLVIFKISEDSIWNYSKSDTARVQALFEENKSKYQFEDRYFFTRVSAANDSSLIQAKLLLEQGVPTDSIRRQINGVVFRDDIVSDVITEPYNLLSALSEGESTSIFEFRNRPSLFILNKKEVARPMNFEEAYFRVVSEYQPIREAEWLQRLRSIYTVSSTSSSINIDTIKKVISN